MSDMVENQLVDIVHFNEQELVVFSARFTLNLKSISCDELNETCKNVLDNRPITNMPLTTKLLVVSGLNVLGYNF